MDRSFLSPRISDLSTNTFCSLVWLLPGTFGAPNMSCDDVDHGDESLGVDGPHEPINVNPNCTASGLVISAAGSLIFSPNDSLDVCGSPEWYDPCRAARPGWRSLDTVDIQLHRTGGSPIPRPSSSAGFGVVPRQGPDSSSVNPISAAIRSCGRIHVVEHDECPRRW